MLTPKNWEGDNTMAYNITLAYGECMYMCGLHDKAMAEFAKMLEFPLNLTQKVSS